MNLGLVLLALKKHAFSACKNGVTQLSLISKITTTEEWLSGSYLAGGDSMLRESIWLLFMFA